MAPLQGKCPRKVGFGGLALEIARHPLAQSQTCPGAKGGKWTPPHGGLLYTRGCHVGCPVLAFLFPYHVNRDCPGLPTLSHSATKWPWTRVIWASPSMSLN